MCYIETWANWARRGLAVIQSISLSQARIICIYHIWQLSALSNPYWRLHNCRRQFFLVFTDLSSRKLMISSSTTDTMNECSERTICKQARTAQKQRCRSPGSIREALLDSSVYLIQVDYGRALSTTRWRTTVLSACWEVQARYEFSASEKITIKGSM